MFWIINAILILIALAFVLPSLLKKRSTLKDGRREQNIYIANEQLKELETLFEQGEIDNEDYQSTRDELEQSLFSDVNDSDDLPIQNDSKASWLSAVLIALLVPVIAIPVYLKVGNPVFTTMLDSKEAAALAPSNNVPKNADGTPDIDTMVAGLQKKMEADPNNAKGWYMLGRSYMVLKRYSDAAKSYERALKLKPESADIMLSLADSLAMVGQGEITGRPADLINKALEIQPDNMTALWLGGMSARQQGKYLVAIKRWKRVLPQVTDPREREEINSLILEAEKKLSPVEKEQLNDTVAVAAIDDSKKSLKIAATDEITVSVSLSDKVIALVKSSDTVFIYAKAMSGPPMPLAAAKIQVKDLPIEVVLNDDMAMMPSMKLSSFSEVVVGARVSKSGQPVSQNGDFFSEKRSITLGSKVSLEIDSIISK